MRQLPPPPPLAQTQARFWFQDQKCGNTGSPCLDKPVLARGTYCGTQVAGIAQRQNKERSTEDKGGNYTDRWIAPRQKVGPIFEGGGCGAADT